MDPELLEKAESYAANRGLVLSSQLGDGIHGIVLLAKFKAQLGPVAIKVHSHDAPFQRERDVYRTLRDWASKTSAAAVCHNCWHSMKI